MQAAGSPSQEATTRETAADPPPSHREDGARAATLPSSIEQIASDFVRSLPCPRSSLLRPQQLPQDHLFCVIEAQRRSSARLGPLDHHLAGSADSDQPAPAPERRNSVDLGLGRPTLVRVVASPGFAESLRRITTKPPGRAKTQGAASRTQIADLKNHLSCSAANRPGKRFLFRPGYDYVKQNRTGKAVAFYKHFPSQKVMLGHGMSRDVTGGRGAIAVQSQLVKVTKSRINRRGAEAQFGRIAEARRAASRFSKLWTSCYLGRDCRCSPGFASQGTRRDCASGRWRALRRAGRALVRSF